MLGLLLPKPLKEQSEETEAGAASQKPQWIIGRRGQVSPCSEWVIVITIIS